MYIVSARINTKRCTFELTLGNILGRKRNAGYSDEKETPGNI